MPSRPMTDILETDRELDAALSGDDPEALQRLLASDVQGELTTGLPHGFGRTYDGLDAMMSEAWGDVAEWFEFGPRSRISSTVARC